MTAAGRGAGSVSSAAANNASSSNANSSSTANGEGGTSKRLLASLPQSTLVAAVTAAGVEVIDCAPFFDNTRDNTSTRIAKSILPSRFKAWLPFAPLGVVAHALTSGATTFVACYGPNDLQVLTLDAVRGIVVDRLVVQVGVEDDGAQRILAVHWLPGSRTSLVVVLTSFVKIFDLAKDAIAPAVCFTVVEGSLADATVVCATVSRRMQTNDGEIVNVLISLYYLIVNFSALVIRMARLKCSLPWQPTASCSSTILAVRLLRSRTSRRRVVDRSI